MFSFLGSILMMLLVAVFVVLMFGISILANLFGGIRNLWNFFTGKNTNAGSYRKKNQQYQSDGIYSDDSTKSTQSADQGHRPHSGGVFKDDEGTYVDFEEIV